MFYGDITRWFIGIVQVGTDPLKMNRIRVRIHGIHGNNIKLKDLPWAYCGLPTTEPATSGIGKTIRLLPNTQVFGIFLDGRNSQIPLVLSTLGKIELIPNEVIEDSILDPSELPKKENTEVTEKNSFDEGVSKVKSPELDASLPGNSNIEKSWNFFLNYGFSEEQCAGILGNLQQESWNPSIDDIDPTIFSQVKNVEDRFGRLRNEGSGGIAQWNPAPAAGNRLQQLINFCSRKNMDWLSLSGQLRFIIYELETHAWLGLSKLKNCKTVAQASLVFEENFERPAIGESTEQRKQNSIKWFNHYGTKNK